MLIKLQRKFLFVFINKKEKIYIYRQKLTDFPIEAINMLDFLTMFIHYGDLPIKVNILIDNIIKILFIFIGSRTTFTRLHM